MSKIREHGKELMSMGHHSKFLSRITKTLYYGKLPKTDRLSLPVTELASELFSKAQQGHSLNRLYCDDASSISRNACVSPCSFVLALLYLERLKHCNPEYLRQVMPSKLFLISLMVSSKFLHDDGEEDQVFVDEWAKSGDITVSELCQLEKEFLNAIDWNVFVGEPTFWARLEQLEAELALREGSKRGWFTYTELKYILKSTEIVNLLQSLVAVSAILAATYTLGVLTLAGSVLVTSYIPGTYFHGKQAATSIPGTVNEASEVVKIGSQNKSLAADVLKTGFILASIQCNDDFSRCNADLSGSDANIPDSTWDWWNNPIMNWLTDVSRTNVDGKLTNNPTDILKMPEMVKIKSHNNSLATDVLKTGLILASIKCNENSSGFDPDFTGCDANTRRSTWDWWNNPIMNWLTDVSKISVVETDFQLPNNYYKNFAYDKLIDMSIASQKKLQLEDKIHKATKMRIQEQMERSWHEEWTDSVLQTVVPYLRHIST